MEIENRCHFLFFKDLWYEDVSDIALLIFYVTALLPL
jgi:hypothetical protein